MKNSIVFIVLFLVIGVASIYYYQNLHVFSEKNRGTYRRTQNGLTRCALNGPYPDKECTPGAIFPDATKEIICVPGYTKTVRNVPLSLKKVVYESYGIFHHEKGEYEVDHLIPLELGGSNTITNLFPEPAEPRPGFHEKDKVENYLHGEVCAGRMVLGDAQKRILEDWVSVYSEINK